MNREQLVDLITAYYHQMDAAKGDYSQMMEIFNEDMCFHFPGIPHPLTIAEFQGPAQGIYAGFSDFKHHIEDVVVDGDKIGCRVNITGTQTGIFQGISPSYKSIAVSAITIFQVKNNRLSEHWISVDLLGIMTQIGAIPNLA